jgi:hypothetical protein
MVSEESLLWVWEFLFYQQNTGDLAEELPSKLIEIVIE